MTDSYFIPVMIAGALLFLIFLFFIVVYILLHTRKQKLNDAERTRLIFEHEEQVLNTKLEEQERVMGQISKEIHDNITQQVDLLQMNLKGVIGTGITPEHNTLLDNSYAITQRLYNELRNISYSLNSKYIKARGLGEVLKEELGFIGIAKNIHCHLKVEGQYQSMLPDTELIVYRIAQEALHNAIKHSFAAHITVTLFYNDDKFKMLIVDDGNGFHSQSKKSWTGLGLRNMQERANLLNAKLLIDSTPGRGCAIALMMDGLKSMAKEV